MNYNYMRDTMVDALRALSDLDISQTPNYRFMVRLCNRLKAEGMMPITAEKMVAAMNITASQKVVDDEKFIQMVEDTYSKLIMGVLNQIRNDFESDPDQVLLSIAHQFKLNMDF